jgi:hypothetical protein
VLFVTKNFERYLCIGGRSEDLLCLLAELYEATPVSVFCSVFGHEYFVVNVGIRCKLDHFWLHISSLVQ